MLEALKTLLFAIACYGIALLLAGCACMALAWLFNHGPTWLQITVITAFLGFFSYAIVDGIINSEVNYSYYYDGPPTYYEEEFGRYR